ncbi:translesion DNA synthesis-associated protein ImuA [Diaphorobacter sp. HDW4A]|uniref:translesion DNA synthesis-associated protein ImuA n=1 Tax=Diaphorobacter sp. HDW4A TaxID=2714924 RepID=UPI00140E6AA3|nr:translesion DNA synthesis-associated protein ImuA [Diaphorobacter sp. HDW4A]QIL80091.1 translesion DNA synthesis-associated protein ImuA [Diaphorobacter sp. HDW4A]
MEPASLSRLGVWKGGDWQSANDDMVARALSSGYAGLDAELPGGGWPVGGMSEILLPGSSHPEWSLVAGALARVLLERGVQQHAVLVAPPFQAFVPFAEVVGVDARQLCCVHPERSSLEMMKKKGPQFADASSVWVSEQALRCRDVCAVLVWLPHAQSQALRRLQLLAAQQRQLLWVFRPEQARLQSSPAPLRLWVSAQEKTLQVQVIKRRGPPLVAPVELPLLHGRLMAELAAQVQRKERAHADATAMLSALRQPKKEASHALDGMAFASRR